ncbi:Nuclear factor NF-kappa-B p105 subunit [Diaporthe australafricana]|uniref:Nuclear factor NF-kappa-B p105 subunit n=1 Tax=Diaporthe australafricana TaxID=127596 RepID=A0ABR3XCV7_9PEZI
MPLTITNADVQALLSVAAQGNTLHTSSLLTILARINRPYDEADIMLLFKDQGGNNLVHIAANNGHPNIITFVCAHSVFNAKPGMRQSILNARNGTSETPIYIAAKGNHTSCVEVLAQNGVAVDAEGPFGFRIAHVAAEIGNFTMLN